MTDNPLPLLDKKDGGYNQGRVIREQEIGDCYYHEKQSPEQGLLLPA